MRGTEMAIFTHRLHVILCIVCIAPICLCVDCVYVIGDDVWHVMRMEYIPFAVIQKSYLTQKLRDR